MTLSNRTARLVVFSILALLLSGPGLANVEPLNSAIAACLSIWPDHPFAKHPEFKTLGTSVKLLGIGSTVEDRQPTAAPTLVLINPIFNVLGSSTIELLNPNGWYCLRTMVSLAGTVKIRAHCKAQLAETSAGSTVRGNNVENRSLKDKAVTMVGSVEVERPCD